MDATYWRVGIDETLPKHWCYSDPSDLRVIDHGDHVTVEEVDCREVGFQVWGDLYGLVRAVLGDDRDGSYTTDDGYSTLFAIEASRVGDGCGEWYSVNPQHVASVRVADLEAFTEWARENEDLEEEEMARAAAEWLAANSRLIDPIYRETLPIDSDD